MNTKKISTAIAFFVIGVLLTIMFIYTSRVIANWPAFKTGQKTVTTKGIPEQLISDLRIPNGLNLVLKAMNGNIGKVTLGYSTTTALNSGTDFFSLFPGESIELNLSNGNLIYLDAESGEGVEYIIETDL